MGVRTKTWTTRVVLEGVRMHDKETVELFVLALEDGMTTRDAAEFAGVSYRCARSWASGQLPHSYTGASRRINPVAKEAKGRAMAGIYDPPVSGPLAGLNPDQIENLLLRAVLADLKAGGWDPASISNRSKCELGERLRLATGLPLRSITGFLRISKSSYEYQRARMRSRRDPDADIRQTVRGVFDEGGGAWGYRVIWARMRRAGVRASEKRVRRVMAQEGLRPAYARRRRRGYSSYEGEVSRAPENLVARDFHADRPDELWVTDVTEFRVPAGRAYLSAVVDCFDGKPVAWSIGRRPTKRLVNSSLQAAVSRMRPGATPIVHSDRGGHYRWPEWIEICDRCGLRRSMSAKGCSPDNAACEGFFGRLKNEFFYHRDWSEVGIEEFASRLDGYLRYYCEGRIKQSLGWLSPNEYRRSLGYAA